MPEQIAAELKPEMNTFLTTKKWNWRKSIKNILVIKKPNDDDVGMTFVRMVKWILSQNRNVYIEQQVYEEDNLSIKEMKDNLKEFSDDSKIDLVITIGGDGTLLYAASMFQGPIPPVMPFHAGSLGFLTRFSLDNFECKLKRVFTSSASCVTYRSRLNCKLIKNDDDLVIKEEKEYLILNDVVVERNPFLSNVDLYINDIYVTTLQGDGIIISTPTGSTAYSSSAGASILHPNVRGNIITPICPHSLSFRPIVLPEDVAITIKMAPESRNSAAYICFDGRHRQELRIGDTLQITSSQYPVPTLLANDEIQEWFDSLSSCLHWNDRQKQKPFKKS